jgi:DNA-binding transcriptional LysR family regulator
MPELLAFESAARHLSFTHAAAELCITQSALSRQILALERFLGTALFQRAGKKLMLTPAGRSYFARIDGPLKSIRTASVELIAAGGATGALTLASVPAFTTKWLIPRLPQFREACPAVTLSFRPHVAGADALPPGVDAAIRYGAGDWPNAISEYIVGREAIVVCAPALAFGSPGLRIARDLQHYPLLQHEAVTHAWSQWCKANAQVHLKPRAGPRFEQYLPLIQAAVTGLGVALVPACLVQDELDSGKLVRPLGESVTLAEGHYLCYPKEQHVSASLLAFRDWLLGSVRN